MLLYFPLNTLPLTILLLYTLHSYYPGVPQQCRTVVVVPFFLSYLHTFKSLFKFHLLNEDCLDDPNQIPTPSCLPNPPYILWFFSICVIFFLYLYFTYRYSLLSLFPNQLHKGKLHKFSPTLFTDICQVCNVWHIVSSL